MAGVRRPARGRRGLTTWRADSDLLRLSAASSRRPTRGSPTSPRSASRPRSAPAGCSARGGGGRRPARLRPDRAGEGLGGGSAPRSTSTSCRSSPTASAPAATSPSVPGEDRRLRRRRGGSASRTRAIPARWPPSSRCGAGPSRPPVPRPAGHTWSTRGPAGASRGGVGHGGRPGAALGRRLGDGRLGRPRPCGATDGGARPRLQPPRPLSSTVKKPRAPVPTCPKTRPDVSRRRGLALLRCTYSAGLQQGSSTSRTQVVPCLHAAGPRLRSHAPHPHKRILRGVPQASTASPTDRDRPPPLTRCGDVDHPSDRRTSTPAHEARTPLDHHRSGTRQLWPESHSRRVLQ